MINNYGSRSEKSLLDIQSFKAIRLPESSGWLLVYTMMIPPQSNYLKTIENEQEQKLSWGKEQGIVTRVIEHGRSKVGSADVIKVDIEMRQGARSVGIFYWSPTDQDHLGIISVIVNPGHYNSIKSGLDGVIASLQIEEAT